ncbi:MAG: hypothetical protein ACQESF_05365 [Nanobdellota archaeon]
MTANQEFIEECVNKPLEMAKNLSRESEELLEKVKSEKEKQGHTKKRTNRLKTIKNHFGSFLKKGFKTFSNKKNKRKINHKKDNLESRLNLNPLKEYAKEKYEKYSNFLEDTKIKPKIPKLNSITKTFIVGLAFYASIFTAGNYLSKTPATHYKSETKSMKIDYTNLVQKREGLLSKLNLNPPETSIQVSKNDCLINIAKSYSKNNWKEELKTLCSSLGKDYPFSDKGKKWLKAENKLKREKENPNYLPLSVNGEPNIIDISMLNGVKNRVDEYESHKKTLTNKLEAISEKLENRQASYASNNFYPAVSALLFFSFFSFSRRKKPKEKGIANNCETENYTSSSAINKNTDHIGKATGFYAPENKELLDKLNIKKSNYKTRKDANTSKTFSDFENDTKLQKKINVYNDYLRWWDERYNESSTHYNKYSKFGNIDIFLEEQGISKTTLYNYKKWVENRLYSDKGDISRYLSQKLAGDINGYKNKKTK